MEREPGVLGMTTSPPPSRPVRSFVCGLIGHKPDPLDGVVQMQITMVYPHDFPNHTHAQRGVLCLRCDVILPVRPNARQTDDPAHDEPVEAHHPACVKYGDDSQCNTCNR